MTALPDTGGRLPDNIVHFARALRRAGLRVGTAQVQTAIAAIAAAGFTHKGDFYAALRACMVTRREQIEVFNQVFAMFWRDPEYLEQMIQLLSPTLRREGETRDKHAAERRAAEALTGAENPPDNGQPAREEVQVEATMTFSAAEKLAQMDFEQMSNAELAEAERAIARLRLPVRPIPTRRNQPSSTGRPDPAATIRRALRRGGQPDRLIRRTPRPRPPDLVVICDISGSMSVYARLFMRFIHALSAAPQSGWGRVQAFTFGTRLTNVTRALNLRDPDLALAAIGKDAPDWQGGTRIGDVLAAFNRDWSRRVLGRGAVVLLITDGLERGDPADLAHQAERLAKSCRRLIWLNPLLRWDGFQAKAGGVRALLPHVDSLHACHSLNSLADLAAALNAPQTKGADRGVKERLI